MWEKDINVTVCWEKIEPVASAIWKKEEKLDPSKWREAFCAVYGLSMKSEFFQEFHPKIESIVTDHVKVIKQELLAHENLLKNYCHAWRDYKAADKNFQMLFSHFNKLIIKENKIYPKETDDGSKRYLAIEDMINFSWKKHMLEPIGSEITGLLWNAIKNEENVQEVVQSFEQVDAVDIFEKTFFEKLGDHYESMSIEWFQGLNVAEFIEKVMQKMEEEVVWCQKFLPQSSIDKMRSIFIEKATTEHTDEMMIECQKLLKENRNEELKKLYKIVKLLPAESKSIDLLSAALRITVRNEALDSSYLNMKEFEANLLSIYKKYRALIGEVFFHNYLCINGLQAALGYESKTDRCDGTKMLEKCMKDLCSSENSPLESTQKASSLKDLLPNLNSILKKLNLPFMKTDNLQMEIPNLKQMILHQYQELEQKKRLSVSPQKMHLQEFSVA
ncbi:Hypothetical predicted protein [Cloeon dipterum]|uniref:Cullin N-terminal domain-containing protein n=1 Tax=Cloeon dipterum TaxID=197152 RepID=A0A8S1DRI1_9INSE|nr:Hypothetical predicted protein [Cloeon dipterum]